MPDEIDKPDVKERQPIVLGLNTTSGTTRWLEHRLSSYSQAKESFVLIITLLVAFLGGPALIFYGMTWLLAGSLGTSGGGAAAIAFNNILYLLLLAFTAVPGGLLFKSMSKPTHLLLSSDGLQYQYRSPLGAIKGPLIPWGKITELRIAKPKNLSNPAEYKLCLLADTKQLLTLQLGWINNIGDRQKLCEYVDEFLPDKPRSLDVALYLQPPSGQSYTEIWFQSLENAPNFETLTCQSKSESPYSLSSE
jgi:hypothetical protein